MLSGLYTGLRAIERYDIEQMLMWRNIPDLRKNFREYRELSTINQDSWFDNVVLNDRNTIMFSLIDLQTDELIGACGLCYINWIHRNADFSLYIGVEGSYIDDTFAPDAGRVLLNYGFNELNLHRIYAEVFEFDQKKKWLMEKLGFSHEGTLRDSQWADGKWNNSLVYGVIRN